jgi:hypothetical protein
LIQGSCGLFKHVRRIAEGDHYVRHTRLSVWMEQWKFYIWIFLENSSRKFKLDWNLTKTTGTLREGLCKFMIIYFQFFWNYKYFRQICIEYLNSGFKFNNFFRKPCRLWDNLKKNYCSARQATDKNTIRRMRIACWINKVTDKRAQNM